MEGKCNLAITKQKYGTLPDGRDVHMYTVDNGEGLKAEFLDFGCVITRLVVTDENSIATDVVLGQSGLDTYIDNFGNLGITVGRFANRMRNSMFEINGEKFYQEPNEGKNICHSSISNFGKMLWQASYDDASSEISFELLSPDGENGYPGDLNTVVTFTLEGKKLIIHYEAVSSKDTPVNLTNHSYFNLNGHLSGCVCHHTLKLYADYYTPTDSENIPTGEILTVKGTPYDFTAGKKVGADMEKAGLYDLNYVLKGSGLRKAAELWGDKTGIKMTTYTDKPGLQLYVRDNYGDLVYKDGAKYDPYQSICLETQLFPNCMEYSHFPSAVVKCGEKYDYTTIYEFEHE